MARYPEVLQTLELGMFVAVQLIAEQCPDTIIAKLPFWQADTVNDDQTNLAHWSYIVIVAAILNGIGKITIDDVQLASTALVPGQYNR